MMVSGSVFPFTLCMSSEILKAPCIGIRGLIYMRLEADGICVSVFTLSMIWTFLPNTYSKIQNALRLKIL